MSRPLILTAAIALLGGLTQPAIVRTAAQRSAGGAPPVTTSQPKTSADGHRATLDKYCVTCHNEKTKTAGLTLDTMKLAEVTGHADTWEAVVKRLRTATMPPAGMPRPDEAT